MGATTGLFHLGDLVAFAVGAGAAAAIGLLRRHRLYCRLIAKYPPLVGLDLWVHMHFLRHPANMVEYLIDAVISSERTPASQAGPRG